MTGRTWRIGVDIGGTFTDVVLVDEATGAIEVVKVPSTPRDFARGVLDALDTATRGRGVAPRDVAWLAHATTVVTNALLEGKGAQTALITTRGFRDVLELRRSARASLYDLFQDGPAVLVPRHLRLEVSERLDAQGQVVEPLRLEDVDEAVDFVKRHDVEAVAVSLLFSFLNDAHERAIGERLRAALPDRPVFLSSEVLPEIREFERASTTAVCAYVGPILASYLGRLESAVTARGFPAPHVMGSSGGVFTVAEGLRMPAMAVESGPAAGVIAAALAGRQLGLERLISFDMGGTTAKASLIERGEIATTSEYEVGGSGNARRWLHGTGHPIRVPVIDLAEVSAGGGSIAWIDAAGGLRVGPVSAGAEPGPACYGRGGEQATVTDASLVLGYLNPERFAGGLMRLDVGAAERAVAAVARRLGLDVVAAAAGIHRVVNARMADQIRLVTIKRGYDPRQFALVVLGGAGPVHGVPLAEEMGMRDVVVPEAPGVLAAFGLLAASIEHHHARTLPGPADAPDLDAVNRCLAELDRAGRARMGEEGVPAAAVRVAYAADMRYVGQAYELEVTIAAPVTRAQVPAIVAAFHAAHERVYGYARPQQPVELVNFRAVHTYPLPRPVVTRASRPAADAGTATDARVGERRAYFAPDGYVSTAVYERARLAVGARVPGPAIVEQMDTTTVIPPGHAAVVDEAGNLRIRST